MKKLLTEFIGTFFLVFTVGMAVASGSPIAILAIGASLMIMVYMGGHISGGHYNPAVSTAALLAKKMEPKDYLPYVATQIVAGIVAGFASAWVSGKPVPVAPGAGIRMDQALLNEALYTFALCLVVLNVACSKRTAGNSYYGLAIGFTIVVAAYAGGWVSGGAYNPAVGIGPTVSYAVLSGGSFSKVWLYVVGPIIGACLAAAVFNVQERDIVGADD